LKTHKSNYTSGFRYQSGFFSDDGKITINREEKKDFFCLFSENDEQRNMEQKDSNQGLIREDFERLQKNSLTEMIINL
jgi:hypothetical protein